MGLSYMKCAVPGCEKARELERSYCAEHEFQRCSETPEVAAMEGKSYISRAKAWRDPTKAELSDPLWNAIWSVIKSWDIKTNRDNGYHGSTGTDVCAVYDAVRAEAEQWEKANVAAAYRDIAAVAQRELNSEFADGMAQWATERTPADAQAALDALVADSRNEMLDAVRHSLQHWAEIGEPTGMDIKVGEYVDKIVADAVAKAQAVVEKEPEIEGLWKCPTCGFQLSKAYISPDLMKVAVNRNDEAELCPNDGARLVPLTYKDQVKNMQEYIDSMLARQDALVAERVKEAVEKERDHWSGVMADKAREAYTANEPRYGKEFEALAAAIRGRK